jgi:hypothetical protein
MNYVSYDFCYKDNLADKYAMMSEATKYTTATGCAVSKFLFPCLWLLLI